MSDSPRRDADPAFGDWPTRVPVDDPDRFADDLVDQLTIDELIGAMSGTPEFWAEMIHMAAKGYKARPYLGASNARVGLPGVRFSDGPRGVALGASTAFPVSMARGATWNPELEVEVGRAMGREARAQGANIVGAVCVNLLRHPGWGRAQETYGESSFAVGRMGVALTLGIQEHVMACVKHFAANSIENARFQLDVSIAPRPLHEVYLRHFERIVDAGVASVMTAYNALNGEWCGQSAQLIDDILRTRWGFDGFVMTDWVWGMRDAADAALAGQDLEMPSRHLYARFLPDLVRDGTVPEAALRASVRRTARTVARFATSTDTVTPDLAVVAGAEHRGLAREVARQSIVLLRNEGDLLPLDLAAPLSVAVIGALAAIPNTGDRGSSRVHPPDVVTPLAGIQAAFGRARVTFDAGDDAAGAADVAAAADVAVVVVGYDYSDEGEYTDLSQDPELLAMFPPLDDPGLAARFGEAVQDPAPSDGIAVGGGGDRRSLRLRPAHEALIAAVVAAQPRTIVVVMSGSAVVMPWRASAPALLMLWYPGLEGGHALADVLIGAANPSGRLPCAFPVDEDGLPPFDPDATAITYELLHGQAWLDAHGHAPAYPLGFGISYSTFTIDGVHRVDPDGDAIVTTQPIDDSEPIRLHATVGNVGTRDGAVVVQCEASMPSSAVERAPRWLVGFERVEVPSGGLVEIEMAIDPDDLAYFDEDRDDFHLEPGDYHLRLVQYSGGPADHTLLVTAP